MSLKRRDFIKIAGGSSLAWPLAQCSLDRLSDSTQKNAWFAAREDWVPTICGACPAGCGLMARKIDDDVVKVEGNPLHPLNRGKVCARGQAGVELLYNPARIKTPLRKSGDRFQGQWQPISWEEALEEVSARLLQLRNADKSHTVAYLGPRQGGTQGELISRFAETYGTPNVIAFDPWEAQRQALSMSQGISELMAVDIENCRYILSFGAQFLSNWPTSMEIQRVYGERRARGEIKIVQVEPRFSINASRADHWIPVNPGTEGLLALGMALVITREELYDHEYVRSFTSNFSDNGGGPGGGPSAFKERLLEQIRLENIADITGVPLRTIIETAKEFASYGSSLAISDYNLALGQNTLFHIQAIHSLNALVGSIGRPGGMLGRGRAPLKSMPEPKRDEASRRGLARPRIDAEAKHSIGDILESMPYEVNCLLISPQALPANFPFTKGLEEAGRKIPFVVSFSAFKNEVPDYADLVLPDTTYFEKWQVAEVSPLSRRTVVGVGRPAVAPLDQSRPFEDTVLALAKRMGDPIAANFPWPDHQALLMDRLSGLYEARKGTIFAPPNEEVQLRVLEERGWWTSRHDSLESFMKDLFTRGGWQDPVYYQNVRSYVFQNAEKRFKFHLPPTLPPDEGLRSSGEEEYPLHLFLYDLPFTAADSGSCMPFFQEALDVRFGFEWKIWVEIHPETARRLALRDKEPVWVESRRGKIGAIAKIFPGVLPHVVAMPLGKEEDFPPRRETRNQRNPLSLLADERDKETGIITRQNTKVRIYAQGANP